LLAVASFTGIRLFDTASRVEVAALPLTERQECGIRFVDAAHLIVATRKEGLRRFTIEKHRNDNAAARREEIRLVDPVTIDPTPGYILGSPSPNAAVVALTSAREGKVRLFDLKSQRTLATIDQLPGVWDYVISPRGWEAASYADVNNMDVAVFSAKTHKLLHPLNAGRSGTLTVSADGRELITTGERGCLVWNVETGAPSTDTPLNLAPAGRSAYTRDGRFFATCADAPIQIYKAQTHELVATLEVRSPPGSSFRLRFSPNGRYLAAQASNNFIQLWDLVELNQALAPLSLNWQ
jgi:WD40 repeat protein